MFVYLLKETNIIDKWKDQISSFFLSLFFIEHAQQKIFEIATCNLQLVVEKYCSIYGMNE